YTKNTNIAVRRRSARIRPASGGAGVRDVARRRRSRTRKARSPSRRCAPAWSPRTAVRVTPLGLRWQWPTSSTVAARTQSDATRILAQRPGNVPPETYLELCAARVAGVARDEPIIVL